MNSLYLRVMDLIHRDEERVALNERSESPSNLDERFTLEGRRVRVVDDHRTAGAQMFGDQPTLTVLPPTRVRPCVLADVDVRLRETLAIEARLPGCL